MITIRELPKVELHSHLDGGLRPATVREIAREIGLELPAAPEALLALLQVSEECTSLVEYLGKFQVPLLCLQTYHHLKRAACEAVEDASKHNVKYIEIRFAPQLHRKQGLSLEEAVRAVLEGAAAGEREFGTIARVILICMRSDPVIRNREVLRAAKKYLGRGVVGMDLAGDEAGYPPGLHRQVFEAAHRHGIPITIHAGEAAGADSIREAVTGMYAARIGHGVRLMEDAELLRIVKAQNIAIEMCPTSNIQTKACGSWEAHPIREYFARGLNVTVHTDNTTVSHTTLDDEFERLVSHYGFGLKDLAVLSLSAAKASFAEKETKVKLVEELRSSFGRMGLL